MTPRHDYQFGNVTRGREHHVDIAREDVERFFRENGFMGTIGSILSSYKTREQLQKGE